MRDLAGLRVDVEATLPAAPAAVWDLLSDVSRVGEWSPECVRATWADSGPYVGARFTGRNRSPSGYEWSVTCVVVAADRPGVFAWVVLGPAQSVDQPSSSWRYDLEPVTGGGTRVRHSFVHGPDHSGLTMMIEEDPQWADRIIAGRLNQLRTHMKQTLAAAGGCLPPP